MTLSGLVELFSRDSEITNLVELSAVSTALDVTAPVGARPLLVATLATKSQRPLLLVTSTYREAERLTASVGTILGDDKVAYYPAWETLPHERLSPRSDTVARRISVLRRLAGNDVLPAPKVVVAPIRSLLQPQVAGLADLIPVTVAKGEDYPIQQLAADLVAAAYTRVDLVERRGEFAVRGGIVDVFPPGFDYPIRIDFFGDEVDELRSFSVADQRSGEETFEAITADPCRELLLTQEVQDRASELLIDHPDLSEMLEKIAQGQTVEGMEVLIPALVDEVELLVDAMPENTLVLIQDPELVRTRAQELKRTSEEFLHAGWVAAAAGAKTPIDLEASAYWELGDVRSQALSRGLSWWSLSQFSVDPEVASVLDEGEQDVRGVVSVPLGLEPVTSWRGDAEAAAEAMKADIVDGWQVVVNVEGVGMAQRLVELLGEHEVGARISQDALDDAERAVTVIPSGLTAGVRLPGIKMVIFGSADLVGDELPSRSSRKLPPKRRNQVIPLELRAGDALVHEQHGVGRFVETVQRNVAGATREYLVLEYAPSKRGQPGDKLFVPMDHLDLVTRYVGGENPQLDRMGGADWRNRKAKARKAVKQIAGELIKLYAARQATRGHQFGPDTPWQREMEDAFNFIETPDQLAAINDVKADMEQVVPMDRLISGDVGYGKTEIAIRAAFKAVQDGKQVAVLVPTTLLVQQHAATFVARYAGFPVNVARLSRFESEKESKATLEGITSGRVDVVIGTHRLLSDAVHFKDLGLVIIDEEQRFGVEHKEALKKLRVNVDVLTMSATPIPRTLEMAITGIREMSTIATPPEERHPVLTFVGAYDEGQIVAAIRRELAREGQVFFLHNRVSSIERIAKRLRELVPEANVAVAHGQMGEKKLEQVILDFAERKFDVLVCTTIVEAGIDIATANTLIVDQADRFGLSQLHQIRGRVGRSRERAYAYFFYPVEKTLSTTAHDRLAALAANSDLGAGQAIAMKDLEIRGAGNMLGGEQSGHIADVGFDLYLRLVGEAVADYRDEGVVEAAPMRIELPVDARLPFDYIESERLRLEMYKRMAEVRTVGDIEMLRDELVDRYGSIPAQAETLLKVAEFRLLAKDHGLTEVVNQGEFIRFAPAVLPESRLMRLQRLYPGSVVKNAADLILVPRPRKGGVMGEPLSDDEVLDWAGALVTAVFPALEKLPAEPDTAD